MNRSIETCRDVHVAMMMSPERWLWHPFLPLKRAVEGREVEVGVLYDAWGYSGLPGYSATVFCWNLLLLPCTEAGILALPHEAFDTCSEIFDAGWRVD